MAAQVRCHCCGVDVYGGHASKSPPTCTLCLPCDRKHGDELQAIVTLGVARDVVPMWQGIARMMMDDAHLTGSISFTGEPGSAEIWIAKPPRRWEVVIARALALGTMPALNDAIGAALAPFIGSRSTRATLDAIAAELTAVMSSVDPSVLSVTVDSSRDALDPEHLIIQVTTTTPTMPWMVPAGDAIDVEIPADIMLRERGKA